MIDYVGSDGYGLGYSIIFYLRELNVGVVSFRLKRVLPCLCSWMISVCLRIFLDV